MPPRFRLGRLAPVFLSPSSSVPTFLVPFLAQSRRASILSSLSDNPGAYSKKIRRGRGPSSGKGKTSGRGHKGQKQHGKVPAGFQGGQTPDEVVRGKEGFENVFAEEMTPLNLDTLQSWISQGRLDPEKPITIRELCKSGAVNTIKDGVKLLARGATVLTTPIHIVVSRASAQAIQAVEAQGGTVTTRFYTPGAIRRIRQGLMDPYVSLRWEPEQIGIPALIPVTPHSPEDRVKGMGYQYRLPDPTSRKEMQYYRDWKNRGYLAHTVKEGEAADLFWKPDLRSSDQFEAARRRKAVKSEVADNRLW